MENNTENNTENKIENRIQIRYQISLGGRIQNCGFRNFCWKCAKKASVTGWVSNDDTDYTKVYMEVQGTKEQIDNFLDLVYKGNGWSKITSLDRKMIAVKEDEKNFCVLR